MGGFPFVAFDVAASVPRIEGCRCRPSRIRCLLIGSCLTRPRSGKGLRDVARSIRRTVRVVEKLYVRRAPRKRFEVQWSERTKTSAPWGCLPNLGKTGLGQGWVVGSTTVRYCCTECTVLTYCMYSKVVRGNVRMPWAHGPIGAFFPVTTRNAFPAGQAARWRGQSLEVAAAPGHSAQRRAGPETGAALVNSGFG
jgi:hypothetical protein